MEKQYFCTIDMCSEHETDYSVYTVIEKIKGGIKVVETCRNKLQSRFETEKEKEISSLIDSIKKRYKNVEFSSLTTEKKKCLQQRMDYFKEVILKQKLKL